MYDNSGHPFQAQLSRLLSDRGHDVVHGHCEAYQGGKGQFASGEADRVRFVSTGAGRTVAKYNFVKRFAQEFRLGFELADLLRRERPDIVLIANTPIPTLMVAAVWFLLSRTPWVLWQQDVYAFAVGTVTSGKGATLVRMAARAIMILEAWCVRRADAVVVIAESFLTAHREWGTLDKTVVISNWAPLDEIVPLGRDNAWAAEQGIDAGLTLLYAGTLGLKHNPLLMVDLAARVQERGVDVRLVVVNSGPAVDVLRAAGEDRGVPVLLAPFQPYERLSEVLASGDVLVVLLEAGASSFSLPSKALTYLCAGRPIVGLLPESNVIAGLVRRAGGAVFPPDEGSIDTAAGWVLDLWADAGRRRELGLAGRRLAEEEFSAERTVARFETVLTGVIAGRPVQ